MKLIIPTFWRKVSLISYILLPVSWIYQFIASIISFVPRNKIYKSKAKIITVGNVTMGGAGKTPVVLSIAKVLKNNNRKKIALLTRGYKGSLKGPVFVNKDHKVSEVGDEALLLKNEFTVCVSKNRLLGIKFLEESGYEIIITDDGLQDKRFYKDLSLMVVDTTFVFGNSLIFPAGPLREDINSALDRSDLIIAVGSEEISYNFPKNIPIVKAKLEPQKLLSKKKYIAFAGIGNPDKFFHTIKEAEGIVLQGIAFADHYQYNCQDMEDLLSLSKQLGAELITTEKDYVRIDPLYKDRISVLPVKIIWRNEDILLSKLNNL